MMTSGLCTSPAASYTLNLHQSQPGLSHREPRTCAVLATRPALAPPTVAVGTLKPLPYQQPGHACRQVLAAAQAPGIIAAPQQAHADRPDFPLAETTCAEWSRDYLRRIGRDDLRRMSVFVTPEKAHTGGPPSTDWQSSAFTKCADCAHPADVVLNAAQSAEALSIFTAESSGSAPEAPEQSYPRGPSLDSPVKGVRSPSARLLESCTPSPTGTPIVEGARLRVKNTFIDVLAEAEFEDEACLRSFGRFTHRRVQSCPSPMRTDDAEEEELAPEQSPPESPRLDTAIDASHFESCFSGRRHEEQETFPYSDDASVALAREKAQQALDLALEAMACLNTLPPPERIKKSVQESWPVGFASASESEPVPEPPCGSMKENASCSLGLDEPLDSDHEQFDKAACDSWSRGGNRRMRRGRGAKTNTMHHNSMQDSIALASSSKYVVVDGDELMEHKPYLQRRDNTGLTVSKPFMQQKKGRCGSYRLWCHIYIDMEILRWRDFDLMPKLIGCSGRNTREVWEKTGTKVRIRGRGSGHLETTTQREANAHLMVAVAADHGRADDFRTAVLMVKNLLEEVENKFNEHCQRKGGRRCQKQMHHRRFWMGEIPETSKVTIDDVDIPTVADPSQVRSIESVTGERPRLGHRRTHRRRTDSNQ